MSYEVDFAEGALSDELNLIVEDFLTELQGTSETSLCFLLTSTITIFSFSIYIHLKINSNLAIGFLPQYAS
jgi:hypothetical protein